MRKDKNYAANNGSVKVKSKFSQLTLPGIKDSVIIESQQHIIFLPKNLTSMVRFCA
jgi:hypothetical protein